MNNENPVNGQPVVNTTSNVVGAQPVMEPMQPQQPQGAPEGQYQQYQAPQGQYQAPVNQYQPQGQYQMYQAPQYQQQYQYRQPTPSIPGNGFCIASLVLGIVSLFFWALPILNIVIIVLAIIFGIVGLTKKRADGKAIAGIIMAGLVAIPTILILISYATIGSIFSWFTNTNTNTYRNYNYNYSYNRNRYDLEDVIDSIFDK